MMRVRLLVYSLAALGLTLAGSDFMSLGAQTLNLMPQPAELTPGQGRLVIDDTFRVALTGYDEPRLGAAAQRLVHRLSKETGIPMNDDIESDASHVTLVIHCDHAGEKVQSLREDESYQLSVTAQQARLTAPTPVGVLRGIETFLQLVDLDPQGFGAPAVEIKDRPRFAWRGLLIDVARHWMPMDVVKRNLDAMAAVKLNVLHWHLSDDQGFRVESKRFPRLQGMGSDGHYFTQEQVREVIAYARERGIRVMPEFDMPGHTTSWFVGYPELASAPGPYSIERHWGIFDPCVDPTREEVYTFLDAFIGEMAELFPDEYFHVGGDEVNGKQWEHSPRIQEFMRAHNMKDYGQLQVYFNQHLLPLVQKHGKKMIGWDEILHPGLPKDIVVHSWRGQQSLADAARMGYMGILSAGYYLDLMHSTASHYKVDPLEGATAGLTPEQQKRVLGGEACMWSEYVSQETVDSRLWPRAAAIAERLWSPQQVKDLPSMYARLAIVSRELSWVGVTHRSNYEPMLARLTDLKPPAALKVLDSVLEPVKDYSRGGMREYTSFTPLNRLVDATRPESDAAREFARLVQDPAANKEQIRKQLTLWRDNHDPAVGLMQRSALLQETVPLADDVATVASAGLEALDYLDKGQAAPVNWVSDKTQMLNHAAKPRAELLIMIVPPVRKLVEAAGKGK